MKRTQNLDKDLVGRKAEKVKKILFVINTMGRAGAETALITLLNRLLENKDFDISLYTMIPQGEFFDRLPKGVRLLNRKVRTESVLSPKGRLGMAKRVMSCALRRLTGFRLLGYIFSNLRDQKKRGRVQKDKLLWRVISDGAERFDEHFDLAVAYIEGAATYYVADHVNADKKASFLHIDYNYAGYTPKLDHGCYDKIDRVFTVSEEVGRQFLKAYPNYADKTFLFRNLLDVEGIRRKAEFKGGFEDDFDGLRLLTIGRLHYQKGYDVAIKAMKIITDDGYNVRWYVLGEGPERDALEAQIKEAGLENRFVLLGAKDNPYPYLKQADIYVHATRFEGKSIAIEEAQILAKPIVASDCTGNTEQITDGYDGLLLTLEEHTLAKTIERVIDDKDLRNELALHVKEKSFDHPEDIQRLFDMLKREAV